MGDPLNMVALQSLQWKITEHPITMDDLGVAPRSGNLRVGSGEVVIWKYIMPKTLEISSVIVRVPVPYILYGLSLNSNPWDAHSGRVIAVVSWMLGEVSDKTTRAHAFMIFHVRSMS